jgi:hypothetical protein
MYLVALSTVSMMYQSCTMFFIITGLAEGYLCHSTWDGNQGGSKQSSLKDNRLFKFRRVI